MKEDERFWWKHYHGFVDEGLSEAMAAHQADLKTYGKAVNNPRPKKEKP